MHGIAQSPEQDEKALVSLVKLDLPRPWPRSWLIVSSPLAAAAVDPHAAMMTNDRTRRHDRAVAPDASGANNGDGADRGFRGWYLEHKQPGGEHSGKQAFHSKLLDTQKLKGEPRERR